MAVESQSKNPDWSGGLYRIPINIGLVFGKKYIWKDVLDFIRKVTSDVETYIVPDIACYPTSVSIQVRFFKLVAVNIYFLI